MRTYAAVLPSTAFTTSVDLFEFVAAAGKRIKLLQLDIGQITDVGDAQAENLGISVIRGYTTTGSGGSTITPTPYDSADAAIGGTHKVANNTIASAGSPVTLHSDAVNIQAGYTKTWLERAAPMCQAGERMVVRLTAPADSVSWQGVAVISEE